MLRRRRREEKKIKKEVSFRKSELRDAIHLNFEIQLRRSELMNNQKRGRDRSRGREREGRGEEESRGRGKN